MQISPADRLTDDLLAFFAYVMKSAQPDVLRTAADLDVTFSQLRALHVLGACERELAVSELSAPMGLSPAATGRAVDALVRAGLVVRHEDPEDRRVKRVALSDSGREALISLMAARREGMRRLAESLGDEEREALSRALAPILERPDAQMIRKKVCG